MADDVAQSQQPEAVNQVPEGEQPSQTIPKQRFDEVYRERAEALQAKERAEQAAISSAAQVAQLMELMRNQNQVSQALPEPVPEIDPDQAKVIEYMTKKLLGNKFDDQAKVIANLTSQINNLTGQISEAQLSSRIPQDVLFEAKKLVATGFATTLEVATKFVLGDRALKNGASGQKGAATNAWGGLGTPTLPFGSASPGNVTNAQVPQKELPQNFERMSPQDKIKALRAARPGFEDAPI